MAVPGFSHGRLVPVGQSAPFPDLNAMEEAYSILKREYSLVRFLYIAPDKGEDVGRQFTVAIRNTDPGLAIKNPPDSQATNLDAVALEKDGQDFSSGQEHFSHGVRLGQSLLHKERFVEERTYLATDYNYRCVYKQRLM